MAACNRLAYQLSAIVMTSAWLAGLASAAVSNIGGAGGYLRLCIVSVA
jgi:hypothetical protein